MAIDVPPQQQQQHTIAMAVYNPRGVCVGLGPHGIAEAMTQAATEGCRAVLTMGQIRRRIVERRTLGVTSVSGVQAHGYTVRVVQVTPLPDPPVVVAVPAVRAPAAPLPVLEAW